MPASPLHTTLASRQSALEVPSPSSIISAIVEHYTSNKPLGCKSRPKVEVTEAAGLKRIPKVDAQNVRLVHNQTPAVKEKLPLEAYREGVEEEQRNAMEAEADFAREEEREEDGEEIA
ncbi:hypothetical protein cyc_06974 [Cyclospora cayetanensis]|uniref:Uncharacterized protein n=1 Tax=Cyclospora cayetanensis TaxID=88456 RepID=A0A1D3D819_9EIME|nr:hypothetical protein cyc_06974 [Cyclospora cayetanensis]